MPKITDYPNASFLKCKEVADAVEALGGTCSGEMCAKKLGKQHTSGSWSVLIGSAGKFGLVENKRGSLTVTERYKQIKYSYTPEERQQLMKDAFLLPPLFAALFDRFKGRELPTALLDKMLVREFSVDTAAAIRVAGYFIDGLKEFGLLDANGFLSVPDETPNSLDAGNIKAYTTQNIANQQQGNAKIDSLEIEPLVELDGYTVRFTGPGLNHYFKIEEEEDFEMISIFLKKVKKALSTGVDKKV